MVRNVHEFPRHKLFAQRSNGTTGTSLTETVTLEPRSSLQYRYSHFAGNRESFQKPLHNYIHLEYVVLGKCYGSM
jgi:hypothetical protein